VVIKPLQREVLFLDSQFSVMEQGFANGPYRNILRFLKEDVCWKSCSSDLFKLFAMMLVVFTSLAQFG